jgi:hypothetical protein
LPKTKLRQSFWFGYSCARSVLTTSVCGSLPGAPSSIGRYSKKACSALRRRSSSFSLFRPSK